MPNYLKRAWLSMVAVSPIVTACGGGESEATTSATSGVLASAVGAATGAGVSVHDLPSFAKVYPGSAVIANMKQNNPDQLSGNVSYSTKASIPELVDFYKKTMAENGLEIRSEVDSGGSYMLSGIDEEKRLQLNVTMFPNQEEDQRMVMMVHAIPNPAKPAETE